VQRDDGTAHRSLPGPIGTGNVQLSGPACVSHSLRAGAMHPPFFRRPATALSLSRLDMVKYLRKGRPAPCLWTDGGRRHERLVHEPDASSLPRSAGREASFLHLGPTPRKHDELDELRQKTFHTNDLKLLKASVKVAPNAHHGKPVARAHTVCVCIRCKAQRDRFFARADGERY
jgi:hypothetical protein